VGSKATLHCGGLAAAIYRRGIPHIFLPLDTNLEDLATFHNTVNMDTREKRGSASNHHPPNAIVLDETLNQHCRQIPSTIKTISQTDHYPVVFTKNLFDPHNPSLSSYVSGNTAFVVISEAADIIYGEKIKRYLNMSEIQYRYSVYTGGENSKYFPQVLELVRQILMGHDPKEILICIGGGVTMDLAGFAAALTQRQYIRIPTTLLGAIDAGIGVKVGCNYQGSKNFLGDFYAPLACLNDASFFQTVAPREMRAGMAEIIKMGIVREPKIIEIIEEYHRRLIPERFQTGRYASTLQELAVYWMLKELQTNLHENRTLKRLVDFGHAFSPFLEIKSNHSILHGEAVAIDMALCTELSYIQGYCSRETRERIINALVAVGLPIFDEICEAEGLLQSLKDISLARGGSLHLPIPECVGKMIFIEQVTYEDLKQAVTHLQTLHEKKRRSELDLPTTGQAYDALCQGLLV
jgi:3-dehydroquinate synthase